MLLILVKACVKYHNKYTKCFWNTEREGGMGCTRSRVAVEYAVCKSCLKNRTAYHCLS